MPGPEFFRYSSTPLHFGTARWTTSFGLKTTGVRLGRTIPTMILTC